MDFNTFKNAVKNRTEHIARVHLYVDGFAANIHGPFEFVEFDGFFQLWGKNGDEITINDHESKFVHDQVELRNGERSEYIGTDSVTVWFK